MATEEALKMMAETVRITSFPEIELFKRGKVRDVYDLKDKLLVVSTDRISCFDVVLPTCIPHKGEVLTPDSSRFWPKDRYQPGQAQPSFDKQFVRDYLETLVWNKTAPGPELPKEIVEQTSSKYQTMLKLFLGKDALYINDVEDHLSNMTEKHDI
jgi:phosphoribosylaminoimidazole-succinocarboxamide synthase